LCIHSTFHSAYNTVFNGQGTPNGFEFIVAIDWFLDRCITALNVTGDTVVARIIASQTPMGELADALPKDVTNGTVKISKEDGSADNSDDVDA
jgi:Na+/H+-dicarboxylate symporter